jgi:hypothetical protein
LSASATLFAAPWRWRRFCACFATPLSPAPPTLPPPPFDVSPPTPRRRFQRRRHFCCHFIAFDISAEPACRRHAVYDVSRHAADAMPLASQPPPLRLISAAAGCRRFYDFLDTPPSAFR